MKYELKVFGRSLGEDRDDVSPSKADSQKRGKDEALFFFIFMFHFQSLPKDTFSNTLKALKFIALSGGVVQINEYGSPIPLLLAISVKSNVHNICTCDNHAV